jgi:hypothetical protein
MDNINLRLALAILAFLSVDTVLGGTPVEPKTIEPSPQPVEPWVVTVGAPAWLAFTNGEVGINGITSHVNVGPIDILRRIDFLASLRAEVSKGRFGVQGEFLYLNASDGIFTNGLVEKLDIRLQQFIGDFGLSYRIIRGDRGWLDLRAGFRYTNLEQDLNVHPYYEGIDFASTQLVNQVSQQLGANISSLVQQNITDKLGALADHDPVLPVGPLGGRLPGTIANAVQNEIQSGLSSLSAAIKSGVQARVSQIEAQLSNQIATTIKTQLNRPFARTDDWFDPYIGLRAQYNLTKAFYVTAKADVGGFGVGSDVTAQISTVFGCQVTRNIFSEVGFRYLYTDYDSNGLLYRVSTYGPELTLGLKF